MQRRGEERHGLRRVRGPGRHRRLAAHHGYVLGPRGQPAGRRLAGRGSGSQDSEVRQGKRAACRWGANNCCPIRGPRCRSATRGKKLTGKIMGADRLRRVRRAGAGHRRPGARQRDELVQAQAAPFENREGGRRSRSHRAGRRFERAAHFAGNEAGAVRSVASSWRRNIRSARWSAEKSATSPNSARSWKSRKDSTA